MLELPQPWPSNPWETRFRTVRASDPRYEASGVRFLTVQSPSLGGRGDLAIYVPPGAEDVADLPVVVLLHGVYGSFWNWAYNGGAHEVLRDMMGAGTVGPMALLMPSDGLAGEGTAYLSHPRADYEAWVVVDAVDCAAEAVDSITARSPLMLCGASMGGYGAMRLGARHASRVTAISAHSTVPDLVSLSQFLSHPFPTDGDTGAVDDLLVAAGEELPPLRFDCGEDDPLIEANRRLHRTLQRAGVTHRYEEYAGAHNWDYWHDRLPDSLTFFDSVLRS